ncbi:MAG: hypothetical protein K0R40_3388 [Burkholderiales bacterium]|nr:hypothetical protein [Burkholderiales bacterium]
MRARFASVLCIIMLNEFFDLKAWAEWFAALEREYIFLLALPFVVALVGLWSWWVDKEDVDREYEARAAQAADADAERKERELRGGAQVPHHGVR